MPFFPEPGEYKATDLPDNETVFRAWLFLKANDALMAKPYREGKSVTVAKSLIEMGERKPALIAASIVAPMPAMFHGFMKKRLGEETTAIVEEFNRHVTTYFTYIDQAPASVQRLGMAFLAQGIDEMQKNGNMLLQKLREYEEQFGTGDNDFRLQLLPDARGYLLVAQALRGQTGNERLEEDYTTAALEYADFRENYLQQLLACNVLPADAKALISRELAFNPATAYPRFADTRLANAPDVRRAYDVLLRHTRASTANIGAAIAIGETLSQTPEVAPATIAAAVIGTGLGQPLSENELRFLDNIIGDAAAIIRAGASRRIGGVDELVAAPAPLRQIALASAVVALDGAMLAARDVEAMLQSPAGPQGQARRELTHQVTRPIAQSVQSIEKTFGAALGRLDAPLLENILSQKIDDAVTRLEDIYEMALSDRPQPRRSQPPRGPR